MTNAYLRLLIGAVTLAGWAGSAQGVDSETVGKRVIALEREKSDLQPNLEYLCTVIGPRLTGSPALQKANEWAAKRMREYGLENVKLEGFDVPTGWERGAFRLAMTAPYALDLTAAQVAWTPGISEPVTAPVVLFTPKSESELDRFRGNLKGAIVITERPGTPTPGGWDSWTEPSLPPHIPALESGPRTRRTNPEGQAPGDLARKASELLKSEGPVAVLVDAGKPYGLLNMWGGWEGANRKTYPTIIVANQHLSLLARLLERGVPVQTTLQAGSRFVPGALTSHSTIGEIRGTDKAEETVLLGAHIDSWDLATGATDNGTGVVAVMEAARLLKLAGVRPRRTIRFALFGGEEQAFGGSLAYIRNRRHELEKLSAVFIHDTGTGQVIGISLEDRPETRPVVERQFKLLHRLGLFAKDPVIAPGRDPGSDHDPFNEAGVPAFALSQAHAEYGLTHHSQADNLEFVEYADLRQAACILAILAYDAAQIPERFPRRPR